MLWFTARTEVDKVASGNWQICDHQGEVPTISQEAEYQGFCGLLKSRVVALDRLEAALAASESQQSEIKADGEQRSPKIIFTTEPFRCSCLSTVHRYRDIGGTNLR